MYGVAVVAPSTAAEPRAASTVAAGRPMNVVTSPAPNIAPIPGVSRIAPG